MTDKRQATLWFLIFFFSVTLVSGLWGWVAYNLEEHSEPRGLDALYRTLLAFTGDDTYIDAHNPGVAIARFTGLVTTISAVVGVAALFLGEQVKRAIAWRRKGHQVIIGASDFAIDIAAQQGEVTVFDQPEALAALTTTASGPLRLTDPMTARTGTGRSLGRAPDAVIFGAKDTITNVERATTWLSTVPKDRIAKTDLILRVEDNSVARDLQLLSDRFAHAKLISRGETVARALVTGMAPTALAVLRGQAQVHVALVGLGSVNLAIAEELALRCHHPDLGPLRLTIIDRDRDAAEARLRAERPDLMNPDFGDHGLAIDFIGLDALECCAANKAEAIIRAERQAPLTAVVVAAGEDTRNLAIAMRLRHLQLQQLCLKAPIFMRSDSVTSVAPRPFDDLSGGIVPFGGRTLDAEDFELERIYAALAEELHNTWRDNLPEADKTDANRWSALTTAQRRSSFRAAMSSVEIFYSAGFAPSDGGPLAGLRLEPTVGNAAIGDAALIDRLAETEHTRWNTERRLEGFRTANDKVRDDEKKVHNLIVPFAELPDDQPEKDVRNVKAALNLGIARREAAPDLPCWRKIWRIGVIGPLQVEAGDLEARLQAVLKALLAAHPDLTAGMLEIVTPNAPGFDRHAATGLTKAWAAITGRPGAVLLLNAARVGLMDAKAGEHIAGGPLDKLSRAARQAILDDLAAQTDALAALRKAGHQVRSLDLRPLGVSDADLNRGPDAYRTAIARAQSETLRLADHMMFDSAKGTARWTLRAMEIWRAQGKTPIEV